MDLSKKLKILSVLGWTVGYTDYALNFQFKNERYEIELGSTAQWEWGEFNYNPLYSITVNTPTHYNFINNFKSQEEMILFLESKFISDSVMGILKFHFLTLWYMLWAPLKKMFKLKDFKPIISHILLTCLFREKADRRHAVATLMTSGWRSVWAMRRGVDFSKWQHLIFNKQINGFEFKLATHYPEVQRVSEELKICSAYRPDLRSEFLLGCQLRYLVFQNNHLVASVVLRPDYDLNHLPFKIYALGFKHVDINLRNFDGEKTTPNLYFAVSDFADALLTSGLTFNNKVISNKNVYSAIKA